MINKSTLMGIYPICQDYICSDIIYLTKIEEVISSGIKVLQLRYKNVSARKKRYLLLWIHSCVFYYIFFWNRTLLPFSSFNHFFITFDVNAVADTVEDDGGFHGDAKRVHDFECNYSKI